MQNFSAPPPQKKGLSKGCLIGIIAAIVIALGTLVLVVAGGLGFYWLRQRGGDVASFDPTTTSSDTESPATGSDDEAEDPQPTAAQSAAISGGQTATWPQQEISWTVPQRWKQYSVDSRSFNWNSPGSDDAAYLNVNVSPMAADFPAEVSTAAFYDQAQTRKQNGEVDEYKYLRLGGVKGVMFRETSPEDDEGSQRLQWIGYRDYKGQKQMINIMLSARGKDFARHEDTLYGILYSTDF